MNSEHHMARMDKTPTDDDRDVMVGTPRGWDPACWPTPAQWVDWYDRCTPDERLEIARRAIRASQDADRCLILGHEIELATYRRRNGEGAAS